VGLQVQPQLLAGSPSDTTLLITSGALGDKLPIGRRELASRFSCDALLSSAVKRAQVLVIAAVGNQLSVQIIRTAGDDTFVVLAPAWRNLDGHIDRVIEVADRIGYLSCNLQKWEGLDRKQAWLERIPLIAVTEGKNGATAHYHGSGGRYASLHMRAFRPDKPHVDTNRAGESFAAAFLKCLLQEMTLESLKRGCYQEQIIRQAGNEAAVAAHLQVQTAECHFADRQSIRDLMQRDQSAGRGAPR